MPTHKTLIHLNQTIDQLRSAAYAWFKSNPEELRRVVNWTLQNLSKDGIERDVSRLATLKLCELQAEYHERKLKNNDVTD
ncbi:MAG: hypothetical protein QM703_18395 [Gemmatales bacterium]